jgi:K+ transporter
MDKIKQFVNEHPQWTSWIVLAIGMVAILVWSARDVGLLAGQWAALIIATILVAGLAVWIIGWEDDEEELGEEDREVAASSGGLFRRRAPKEADDADSEGATTEEA